MNKLVGAALLLCACVGLAFAQTSSMRPARRSKGQSVSATLMQAERDWLEAAKTANLQKLDQIIADDWVGIGFGSERMTKQQFIGDIKSGAIKIESFEMGPMSVKVLGTVAVVQGSDTQKSTANGKEDNGKEEWMDVFVKRGGRWVAVRSQEAKAE